MRSCIEPLVGPVCGQRASSASSRLAATSAGGCVAGLSAPEEHERAPPWSTEPTRELLVELGPYVHLVPCVGVQLHPVARRLRLRPARVSPESDRPWIDAVFPLSTARGAPVVERNRARASRRAGNVRALRPWVLAASSRARARSAWRPSASRFGASALDGMWARSCRSGPERRALVEPGSSVHASRGCAAASSRSSVPEVVEPGPELSARPAGPRRHRPRSAPGPASSPCVRSR